MSDGHYHLNAKVFSRRKGHSAVAAAAYRSGEKLKDARTGETHDYRRRGGVVHSEILLPDVAPEWANDRAQLWNSAEAMEKRNDAQVAREMDIGLPHQLSADERRELIRSFIKEQFTAKGMVADLAIHEPQAGKGDDRRNHHAHVMLTMRQATRNGFRTTKTREWNSKDQLEAWRAAWAEHANHALERAGHETRLDHRSYKERGIDQQPEIHLGKRRAGMVKRGAEPAPPKPELTREEERFVEIMEKASPAERRLFNRPQSRWARVRRSVNYKRLQLGDRVHASYQAIRSVRRGQTARAEYLRGQLNQHRGDRQEYRRQHRRAAKGVEEIFKAAYKDPGQAMQRFKMLVADKGLARAVETVKASPSRLGARKGIRVLVSKEKSREEGDRLLKFLDHRVFEMEAAAQRLGPIEEMFRRIEREIERERARKARVDDREREFRRRWIERSMENQRRRQTEAFERDKRRQEAEEKARRIKREAEERAMELDRQGRRHEAQAVRENQAEHERRRLRPPPHEHLRETEKAAIRERERARVQIAKDRDSPR